MKALSILCLVFAALAAPALGQVPVMLPEFRVNTSNPDLYTSGGDLAMGNDGRFVVTWFDGWGGGILGRQFDARCAPLGDPFRLQDASISRDASGSFVSVWGWGPAGLSGQRFGSDGTPLGDVFPVTAPTTLELSSVAVASDPSGNFVVTWTAAEPYPGDRGDVVARRFDSAGAPVGSEFPVNEWTTGVQGFTRVAVSPAGFVVTWLGNGASGPGLFGRLFGSNGTPMTSDFRVDSAAGTESQDVAMSASGEFVIVWAGGYGSTSGATGRRYTRSGAPIGTAFPISAASGAYTPRVASDSAGNFLVAWTSWDGLAGSTSSVAARHYDISGSPVAPEFEVGDFEASAGQPVPAVADDGSFVMVWTYGSFSGQDFVADVWGRKSGVRAAPEIRMDPSLGVANGSVLVAGNGVFEPGETLWAQTAWINDTGSAVELSGTSTGFSGPPGAEYTLNDGFAYYGTVPAGQGTNCVMGANCHAVTVSAPAVRPVQHWDARLQETLSIGVPKTWVLHIGESFADVSTGDPFYRFVETLFHNGVTGGCSGGGYCPANSVTRAQMAVFLLKSRYGAAHVPPPCTGAVFTDVPCTGSPFDPWIEELAGLGISDGCGGTLYCPGDAVTREQMAVFLLKSLLGSAYTPPACAQQFEDVPCSNEFAAWINDLHARGVTGGCSVAPALYCPGNVANRGQMAAFLVRTFSLVLYGG